MIARLARDINPHAPGAGVMAGSANDNGPGTQEPDEVKVSRPVREWRRGGRPPRRPELGGSYKLYNQHRHTFLHSPYARRTTGKSATVVPTGARRRWNKELCLSYLRQRRLLHPLRR
jgi:hypothetical protein